MSDHNWSTSKLYTPPPTSWQSNPLSSGQTGQTGTVGGTGQLGGDTVQVAQQAQAPAPESGIGDKIKSFFKAIGNFFVSIGRAIAEAFTPAPQAQAPVVQQQPPGKVTTDYLLGKIEIDQSTTTERHETSFAYTLNVCNNMTEDSTGTFLRSGNPTSKSSRAYFLGSEAHQSAISTFTEQFSSDKIAVGRGKFEALLEENPELSREDLAKQTVDGIDRMMVSMFGDPDDQTSIDEAVSRLPQALCDHLALVMKAIDDSDLDPSMKQGLKEHAARDTLALRTFNPTLTDIVTSENSTPTMKFNAVELSKGIQTLLNGVQLGVGKDGTPDIAEAGKGMSDRWVQGFAKFTEAVLNRADPEVVTQGAQNGAIKVTEFQLAAVDWNTKVDQGIDPRV